METGPTYSALVVEESTEHRFTRTVKELPFAALPDGELLIRVSYSSLNYKDALSAAGNRGVTRCYPHTPGIDAAGIVAESSSPLFSEGDAVMVGGYDLGMNTPGGFGRFIRVPADWALRLPEGLTLKESMIYGTAGFTAAMAAEELLETVTPGEGEVLVTGATGGVGCFSVALLSALGYRVIAVSGKPDAWSFLGALGAEGLLSREDAVDRSGQALLRGRWAGVIDNVGGEILSTAIRSAMPMGTVIACGNASSPELLLTVYPFILRGVRLIGIDSQHCSMERRRHLWNRLASEWKPDRFESFYREISLKELSGAIDLMLQGELTGRVVINHEL